MTQVEESLLGFRDCDLTVAVMGCVVNGPGEAQEADVGVAMGHGQATLFERGREPRQLPPQRIVDALVDAVKRLASSGEDGNER